MFCQSVQRERDFTKFESFSFSVFEPLCFFAVVVKGLFQLTHIASSMMCIREHAYYLKYQNRVVVVVRACFN